MPLLYEIILELLQGAAIVYLAWLHFRPPGPHVPRKDPEAPKPRVYTVRKGRKVLLRTPFLLLAREERKNNPGSTIKVER